jgi:hypothetical protein
MQADRFEDEFMDKLKLKLTSVIQSAETGSTPNPRILSEKGFRYERMAHFLSSGALPWYSSDSDRMAAAGNPVDFSGELTWLLREMPDKVRAFLRSRRHDKNVMSRTLSLFDPRPEKLFQVLIPGQQQTSDFYSHIKENTDAASLTDMNITYLQALLAAGAGKPFWMSVLAFLLLLDRDGRPPPVRLISALFNQATPGKSSKHGRKLVLTATDLEKISEALNSSRTAGRQGRQPGQDTHPSTATLADLFSSASIKDQTGKKSPASSSKKEGLDRRRMAGKSVREDVDDLVRNIRLDHKLEPESDTGPDDGPAGKGMGTSADTVIRDAGLILLWPFLSRFFHKLELATSEAFTDEPSRMKAMLLLGYLVSGEERLPEHRMPLIKMLCGQPASRPLQRPLPLSNRVKQEADVLLESVITHWKVLKNTSINGLRRSFLQRDGLLRQADESWKLYVDRKSYDILLDKLPWSYSTVKLPWMEHALTVDW